MPEFLEGVESLEFLFEVLSEGLKLVVIRGQVSVCSWIVQPTNGNRLVNRDVHHTDRAEKQQHEGTDSLQIVLVEEGRTETENRQLEEHVREQACQSQILGFEGERLGVSGLEALTSEGSDDACAAEDLHDDGDPEENDEDGGCFFTDGFGLIFFGFGGNVIDEGDIRDRVKQCRHNLNHNRLGHHAHAIVFQSIHQEVRPLIKELLLNRVHTLFIVCLSPEIRLVGSSVDAVVYLDLFVPLVEHVGDDFEGEEDAHGPETSFHHELCVISLFVLHDLFTAHHRVVAHNRHVELEHDDARSTLLYFPGPAGPCEDCFDRREATEIESSFGIVVQVLYFPEVIVVPS